MDLPDEMLRQVLLYKALAEVADAVMRARSREDLFEEVCFLLNGRLPFGNVSVLSNAPGEVEPASSGDGGAALLSPGAAEFALSVDGQYEGVLQVAPGLMPLDEETLQVLQRVATLVSCGLERLEQESRNKRLSRMYTALLTTGEAILHCNSINEMCQAVCDAAVHGSKFSATAVLLVEPGEPWLKAVGTTGFAGDVVRTVRISHDESLPEGRGLAGTAFRTKQPCVSNDWLHDPRSATWATAARLGNFAAVAALPLVHNERVDGVLMFFSRQSGEFGDEMVFLLSRLAKHVSFALEKFQQDNERKLVEARIQHMALYDELTGLPNRTLIRQLLRSLTHATKRYARSSAVMFVDLDGFKAVNDTLGHETGDELLKKVGERMSKVVRASDTVGRLGGDEFVVLLDEVGTVEQAERIAAKLLEVIAEPVMVQGKACKVGASIGIAIYPADGCEDQTLLRRADAAMYASKQAGGHRYTFYSDESAGLGS